MVNKEGGIVMGLATEIKSTIEKDSDVILVSTKNNTILCNTQGRWSHDHLTDYLIAPKSLIDNPVILQNITKKVFGFKLDHEETDWRMIWGDSEANFFPIIFEEVIGKEESEYVITIHSADAERNERKKQEEYKVYKLYQIKHFIRVFNFCDAIMAEFFAENDDAWTQDKDLLNRHPFMGEGTFLFYKDVPYEKKKKYLKKEHKENTKKYKK